MRNALYGLCVGLMIAGYGSWRSYHLGIEITEGRYATELAKSQAAMIAAADLASRKEAERLVAQQAADEMARDLEDQANADQTGGCTMPLSRVMRLNRYSTD